MPIVDCGVEHIDAVLDRVRDGVDIVPISVFRGFAQIGAETNGGEPQFRNPRHIRRMTEVSRTGESRETVTIAGGTRCGGETGDHQESVAVRHSWQI